MTRTQGRIHSLSAAAGLLCWLVVVELLFGTEGRCWNLGLAPGLESDLELGLGLAPGLGLGLGSEQVKVANNMQIICKVTQLL